MGVSFHFWTSVRRSFLVPVALPVGTGFAHHHIQQHFTDGTPDHDIRPLGNGRFHGLTAFP